MVLLIKPVLLAFVKSDSVKKLIIDLLKIINVDQHQAEGLGAALGTQKFRQELFLKCPPVGQAG